MTESSHLTQFVISVIISSILPRASSNYTTDLYPYSCEYVNDSCENAETDTVFVQRVHCWDSSTVHICCNMPYPEDVRRSREKSFQKIFWTARKVSYSCTKRILCELSCMEGWKLKINLEYPGILLDLVRGSRDIVEAYLHGLGISCFGSNSASSCESACRNHYPDCEEDIEESLLSRNFYASWKYFKDLGMWFFSATLLVQDELVKNADDGIPTVKNSYHILHERMARLDTVHMYLETGGGCGDGTLNWHQFLGNYKKIDPQLMDSVNNLLTYSQFKDVMQKIDYGLRNCSVRRLEYANTGAVYFIHHSVIIASIFFGFVVTLAIQF